MPTLVNRHHFAYVDGVGPPPARAPGKPKRELPEPWIYCGHGSPLGNPFRSATTAEIALARYRVWLWDRMQRDDARVWLALRSITEDTHLVCSCMPKPCHTETIRDAWEWARRESRL